MTQAVIVDRTNIQKGEKQEAHSSHKLTAILKSILTYMASSLITAPRNDSPWLFVLPYELSFLLCINQLMFAAE